MLDYTLTRNTVAETKLAESLMSKMLALDEAVALNPLNMTNALRVPVMSSPAGRL